MAHNLDSTNGTTSFVTARQDAWHQLGQVLPAGFTANEALEHGYLGGWNTRKVDIYAAAEDGELLQVPNRFAVIRDNPVNPGQKDVLGNVGAAYRVIQNEDLAGLLDTMVDESGAHFETAGAVDGGAKVFITMRLPEHVLVGGVDRVDQYLAAMTSHDGSMPTTVMVTPIRIVCQNTMNLAFKNSRNAFRVRHTSGAKRALVQQARDALEFSFKYLDNFAEEAERLVNTPLSLGEFERIMTEEFGPADLEDAPKAVATRWENKIDEMMRLFVESNTHKAVRDTAWAGVNSMTEWYDHFAPVRDVLEEDAGAVRARKALLLPDFKNRARKAVLRAVA